MNRLLFLTNNIDPIQGTENLIFKILGLVGAFVVLTVAIRSAVLLNKMNFPAIIGVISVGILILLFTQGKDSYETLKGMADVLVDYMKGEGGSDGQ